MWENKTLLTKYWIIFCTWVCDYDNKLSTYFSHRKSQFSYNSRFCRCWVSHLKAIIEQNFIHMMMGKNNTYIYIYEELCHTFNSYCPTYVVTHQYMHKMYHVSCRTYYYCLYVYHLSYNKWVLHKLYIYIYIQITLTTNPPAKALQAVTKELRTRTAVTPLALPSLKPRSLLILILLAGCWVSTRDFDSSSSSIINVTFS